MVNKGPKTWPHLQKNLEAWHPLLPKGGNQTQARVLTFFPFPFKPSSLSDLPQDMLSPGSFCGLLQLGVCLTNKLNTDSQNLLNVAAQFPFGESNFILFLFTWQS